MGANCVDGSRAGLFTRTCHPTYGIDLILDAAATRDTRAQTAAVLGLTNVCYPNGFMVGTPWNDT